MRNRIVLSTIQAAKGLEFDHVIIPDVNADTFDGSDPDEKNLFYVATSRACNLLTITHRRNAPSRYLTCFAR
ncbi:3'-5' exonuclease [Hydrogenophaga sp.]|uniref:3'-5' exonuclease n=1 Tax=Hydrogenophaga sp. TaxID=1904254 RepID=UPI00345D2477